jgi:HTH-type transcriptional regulator, competence development regulator
LGRFGEYIKNLREKNSLLQRQVSSGLNIDTPMLSKIERGERKAKREYIPILATMFNSNAQELLAVWLADKVYDIVKDEEEGLKAIQLVEADVKNRKRKM